jgi:hypothetical protein
VRRLTGALRLALAGALAAGLLAGCREIGGSPDPGSPHSSTAPARPGGSDPTEAGLTRVARRIARLQAGVEVVEGPGYHPGYDRSCGAGGGCVFGEEWTDDHPGRFGRNGCDTRQDVLLRQMGDIELRWGSTCRLYDATLVDPYSGERLTWRDDGYWIQIDHVYPLARAWHAGAWAWPQARRVRFANDVDLQLLAVSARANQDKGAAGPAAWLPPNPAYRCGYVTKYLLVAAAYDLPITRADSEAVSAVARRC